MLPDAVLDDREFTWLGPSMDKRRHFMRYLEGRLEPSQYPRLLFGDGPTKAIRYFPDKLPSLHVRARVLCTMGGALRRPLQLRVSQIRAGNHGVRRPHCARLQ